MKKLFGCARKCSPYLLLFLIPVVNFYLLEWYTHDPFSTMEPRVQLLNIALFEIMALFLFALTGRINAALMIQTAFCAVYGLAGFYVLEFRGAPIQPWDLFSIGTAASVLIQGIDFSVTCYLGVISLMGIIVRNGIIMIDYAEELRLTDGMHAEEAIYHSAKRRMRPIFLTSAAASMGVIPMILGGSGLWMPMGTVVCYGTLITMVFILTVLPAAYLLIFRGTTDKRLRTEAIENE